MKKQSIILICCMCVSYFMFSQDKKPLSNQEIEHDANQYKFGKNFRVSIGLNAVNNTNKSSPYGGINDWAIGIPISFGIESTIKRNLFIEQSFSINKFKETSSSNGLKYFSTSTNIKYFLDDIIKSEKFQVFASAGLGIFNIQETSTSGNLGGGLQYWISDKMAIRFKTIGKFAFKTDKNIYDNNHFQHHLELVYKL